MRVLAWLLAALLLAAAVEAQPLAVYLFYQVTHAVYDYQPGPYLGLPGASGVPSISLESVLALVTAAVGGVLHLLSGFSALKAKLGRGWVNRIALGLLWVVGLLVFWFIFLSVLGEAIFLEPGGAFSDSGPMGPLLVWLATWNGWMLGLGALLGSHEPFLRQALPQLTGYFYTGWLIWLVDLVFVDLNRSSPHGFYRDRLAKAYLGVPEGPTDSVWVPPRDDRLLTDLDPRHAPYSLINGTLNLPRASNGTPQGRHADFFLFSRHYVGAPATGYCDTALMQWAHPNLTLASAVAISGAAASPNMGLETSLPLRMTLALLNVRLGYWLPNPHRLRASMWRIPRPVHRLYTSVGPLYLFREMFGLFGERSGQVNVSDGGHIENLGVYELLRRRCRLIVACDAEQDAGMTFGGLVNAIRLARIDMGIQVDIDLEPLHPRWDGYSPHHFVVGTIHYGEGELGALIYLKSSVTGREHPDVLAYREDTKSDPGGPPFPHQTTADQFFDERQFEAYRALGHQVASEMLLRRSQVHRNPDPRTRTPDAWLQELPAGTAS